MRGLDGTESALVERAAASELRETVERWAAINSGSHNLDGLAQVATQLANAFSALPGDVRLVEPAPVARVAADGREEAVEHGRHLVLTVRPQAERRVLLTGHMDTVFGVDHPFQKVVEREPGVLNGPGVADMKGGIAVMLAALQALEASGTSLGYDVMINSDEETGSASSAALIGELARGKYAALTYEPSALPDGTLAGARPGSGNFSFSVRGRAAHAGRNPQDGRNALVAAAALALGLDALRRPGLSVNPAKIDGGGPNNVVPDLAVLRVNLRPATLELEQAAREAMAASVAEVIKRYEVTIDVHGGFGRPPKPVSAEAQKLFDLVERCGQDLGQVARSQPSGGVCDGNNIAAHGVPVVDTMGARGGAIHSADEYLILQSLGERAALSALTLHRLERSGL